MRRYLVVDDNPAFAENLGEILEDCGAAVDIANSGEKALALAGATRYDALVSDMRMPAMGGAELVHRIRGIDPGLPAIVVTAYIGDNELAAARAEGLHGVLPKPVPIERLVALLGQARRDGVVVIVEDDAALADNLSELLRGRGFAAITAQSVLETEKLGVRPFAAVVDLRVPGGSDGEAMRRLAARFSELPMFVVSALDVEPPVVATRRFGKPFDTAELLDAVEAAYQAHG
ncbi:MAG TPA: response regulator [Polyangia bacterium]|nr:response regulator [Polyangia bacterium]